MQYYEMKYFIIVIFLFVFVLGCDSENDEANAVNAGDLSLDIDEYYRDSINNESFDAEPGKWTFIPFLDSKCRDGSESGILINLSGDSTELVIFLEEGGACFETRTCALNKASLSENMENFDVNSGIFDRANEKNPVKNWNYVFVPYCTGDVHAGSNSMGVPPGVSQQHFAGYDNMEIFLDRLVLAFTDAKQVLLTGSSAGGFGALMTADLVASRFSPVPIVVVSDSGPLLTASKVPPCFQDHWRNLWGFDNSILASCDDFCPDSSDYMIDFAMYVINEHPTMVSGLISSTYDWVIRMFFASSTNECVMLDGNLSPWEVLALINDSNNVMSEDSYYEGIMEFRQIALDSKLPFGTYYIESDGHIWLTTDDFYSFNEDGVSLSNWLENLLQGNIEHVGP